MRMTFFLCAALYYAAFALTPSVATTAKFPGSVKQAPSPDGRFVVLNTDRDEEPNHVLSLQDTKLGSNQLLFPYRRHVEVSWSNDSKFFFVNDYAESDLADCVVINVDGQKQIKMSTTLGEELLVFTKNFKGSHLYVTCSAWHSNDELLVSVIGYGDGSSKAVEQKFVFNAQNGKVARGGWARSQ